MKSRSTNKMQILIGVIVLAVGSLVYLVDRPPEHTYFVSSAGSEIGLHDTLPILFGFLGNILPAFAHTFSFILITAGLLCWEKKGCLIICLGWFLIGCTFELGQKFSVWSSKLVPDSFSGIPVLENTKNFFLLGTFDVFDVLAMALGALTAYLVVCLTMKRQYAPR